MYYSLSIAVGAIIAIMIVINGNLTGFYGTYAAAVIIHVVGLVSITVYMLLHGQTPKIDKKLPFYAYLGGAVGVCTTLFNNIAFGVISVSAIVALILLGQTISSMAVDGLGLFNLPKVPFKRKKLLGILFITIGIILMVIPF